MGADREEAGVLRAKAVGECAAAQWKACLEDLDAAKALDPGGEDAEVRTWRLAAEAAVQGGEGGR
jgi:hypothetical protein